MTEEVRVRDQVIFSNYKSLICSSHGQENSKELFFVVDSFKNTIHSIGYYVYHNESLKGVHLELDKAMNFYNSIQGV